MLRVNHPIHAGVDKLAMQQAGAGHEQRWVNPNLGSIRRSDRHRRWLASLKMLIRSKPEQFVLDYPPPGVGGVIVQFQFRLRRRRR